MTLLSSNIYRVKSSGPKIDPWGTLQVILERLSMAARNYPDVTECFYPGLLSTMLIPKTILKHFQHIV